MFGGTSQVCLVWLFCSALLGGPRGLSREEENTSRISLLRQEKKSFREKQVNQTDSKPEVRQNTSWMLHPKWGGKIATARKKGTRARVKKKATGPVRIRGGKDHGRIWKPHRCEFPEKRHKESI